MPLGARCTGGRSNVGFAWRKSRDLQEAGLAGGWKLDNAFLREKATGAEYVLTIVVPDSQSDASFAALARVVLGAFKAGRLSATPVVP